MQFSDSDRPAVFLIPGGIDFLLLHLNGLLLLSRQQRQPDYVLTELSVKSYLRLKLTLPELLPSAHAFMDVCAKTNISGKHQRLGRGCHCRGIIVPLISLIIYIQV